MKDQIGQKILPGDIVVMNANWSTVTIGRVSHLTKKRVMIKTITGYQYISPRMPERVLKIIPDEYIQKHINKLEK